MLQTLGWVLFGFAVWGLAILLHALQRRFAPDLEKHTTGRNSSWGLDDEGWDSSSQQKELKKELQELRQRVEILEAIVTDKKFQFDQELNRK